MGEDELNLYEYYEKLSYFDLVISEIRALRVRIERCLEEGFSLSMEEINEKLEDVVDKIEEYGDLYGYDDFYEKMNESLEELFWTSLEEESRIFSCGNVEKRNVWRKVLDSFGLIRFWNRWECEKQGNEIRVYILHEETGFYLLHATYKLLEEPFCHVCSMPGVITSDCTYHLDLYGFDRIYVLGKYIASSRRTGDDSLSDHILKLKVEKEYALPLGKGLAMTLCYSYHELLNSDFIVPVPLHSNQYRERRYNQALELGRVVSEYLKREKGVNIPVVYSLRKTKNVKMHNLSRVERKKIVKGLYEIIENKSYLFEGKKVILIDDVVTTGFTVSECSRVLKEAGAREVNVLALARTV